MLNIFKNMIDKCKNVRNDQTKQLFYLKFIKMPGLEVKLQRKHQERLLMLLRRRLGN